MDEINKFLDFCNENDSPAMSIEDALEYFKLRKNANIKILKSFENNPCVAPKLIECFTDDVKMCEENIKKLES